MPTKNTLKIRASGGKSQMRVIPAGAYHPESKAPSKRDWHRQDVRGENSRKTN